MDGNINDFIYRLDEIKFIVKVSNLIKKYKSSISKVKNNENYDKNIEKAFNKEYVLIFEDIYECTNINFVLNDNFNYFLNFACDLYEKNGEYSKQKLYFESNVEFYKNLFLNFKDLKKNNISFIKDIIEFQLFIKIDDNNILEKIDFNQFIRIYVNFLFVYYITSILFSDKDDFLFLPEEQLNFVKKIEYSKNKKYDIKPLSFNIKDFQKIMVNYDFYKFLEFNNADIFNLRSDRIYFIKQIMYFLNNNTFFTRNYRLLNLRYLRILNDETYLGFNNYNVNLFENIYDDSFENIQ